MRHTSSLVAIRLSIPILAALSCAPAPRSPDTAADTAANTTFAEVQRRGQAVMGVDQYTSTHQFDKTPDGGRIELRRDADDPAGIETIRAHMREIADAFAAGDFSASRRVHGRPVPGTDAMSARREAITYTVTELPGGAEVRIRTFDADAVRAIHRFMDFQREDHRAGGADREHRHP